MGATVHNQDPMTAQRAGDNFIGLNERTAQLQQADWIASGHTGVAPGALTAFGNALHTVTDRTSPTHAGNQPWHGTQGPGNLWAAGVHVAGESTINAAQMNTAVNAARNAFRQTFGDACGDACGDAFYFMAIQPPRPQLKRKKKDYATDITIT
jgi:hypothetical protein